MLRGPPWNSVAVLSSYYYIQFEVKEVGRLPEQYL